MPTTVGKISATPTSVCPKVQIWLPACCFRSLLYSNYWHQSSRVAVAAFAELLLLLLLVAITLVRSPLRYAGPLPAKQEGGWGSPVAGGRDRE